MTAVEVLGDIKQAGLTITVVDGDKLVVEPKDRITETLRSQIKECKIDLIALLSGDKNEQFTPIPAPCQICLCLEMVYIMGASVPGCLYRAEEPYIDGWRRLPADLNKCLWY